MNLNIQSHIGIEGYPFGTSQEVFRSSMGLPDQERINQDGELEYHYDRVIIRFDAESSGFRECTFFHGSQFRINNIDINWSANGLHQLCDQDGNPQECYGTILLLNLGISLTGIADDNVHERSLSAFRKGDWDEFTTDMSPIVSVL